MKRQISFIGLLFALGLTLCGCKPAPAELSVDLPVLDTPGAVSSQIQVEETTVDLDDVSYTLLEVNPEYVSTGKYATPKAGYRFVTVKMRYENHKKVAFEVSSLLMLSVVDELGNEYPITITISDLPATLDGTILPQETLEGYAAFEIPQTVGKLTLMVHPNLFAEEQAEFILF